MEVVYSGFIAHVKRAYLQDLAAECTECTLLYDILAYIIARAMKRCT